MNKQDSVMKVIAVLNSAFEADEQAMTGLFDNFVPCNEDLANHDVIRVGKKDGESEFHISAMGVINGLLEVLGIPRVASVWDGTSEGDVLVGFCEYRIIPDE